MSRGAFLVGIGEHAEVVESHRVDEALQLREVLLGFARKTDYEGCSQGDARHARADAAQQALIAGTRARPLHSRQDRVGGVLERQVDVLTDLVTFRHGIEYVVSNRGRVEVQHPDPLEAVGLVQRAQQPGERTALAAVYAEEAGVLGNQQQFLDAISSEGPCLFEDRLSRATAVVAPK